VTFADGTRIWLCRARGTVRAEPFEGFATRVSAAGDDALARTLALRLESGVAVVLAARRGRAAAGHGDEQLDAVLARGDPPVASAVERPRLSTTYDGAGLVTHCGIELWESGESEFPERIGGEAVLHGELVGADGTRTRIAFLDCHGGGAQRGGGRYAIEGAAATGA